ncbi:hypothetical protein QQP08_009593 [Theobroma cacao]|nr:hypothetical protein QQP08_009593 [Theobroma cacao]
MHPRHGANDNIGLLNSLHQAFVIIERALHKLVDVEPDLRALEDVGFMALSQACLDNPPADIPSSPHHKNLTLGH